MIRELKFPTVNNFEVSGHLTKDAELKYLQSGKPVIKMSLAFNVNKKVNNEWTQEACFINVTSWDKRWEEKIDELVKGAPILCAGRLEIRGYTDKEGNQRNSVDVTAYSIHCLQKTSEFVQEQGNADPSTNQPSTNQKTVATITNDDVPF